MTEVLPLVPLPQRVAGAGERSSFGTGGTVRIAVPTGVPEGTTAWFASWAARLHGLEVLVSGDGEGPADVRVVLGPAAALGLDGVPAAEGVDPRPDPVDERHRVTASGGRVLVEAAHPEGVFRALTTVLALVGGGGAGKPPATVPDVVVDDGPAYRWRGLSLDVVRHFSTPAEVRRVIDLLGLLKLNVLHLHLTDSQGWRLEVPARPALTADGDHYSARELADLVAYAAARHVVVVPEVDLPGHTAAASAAYPEVAGDRPPVHPYAVFLDPDVPAALDLAGDVLDALVDVAPGPFVHVGADEAFGMPAEPFGRFVRWAHDHVRARGKRAVAWQEAGRAGALGADDVLQYWIGPDHEFDAVALKGQAPAVLHPLIDEAAALFAQAPADVPRAAADGVPVLVSSSTSLYLDRRYAGRAADPEGEGRRGRVGMPGYTARTPGESFAWHPRELPELAGATVAGVEAAVWCESVGSFDDLAFLLLPRLAGAAEKAWTSAATSWADHAARAAACGHAWDAAGFTARYVPAAPG